ncbi:MAG: peptide-methionine (R)-S-oxide reductase, partial [Pyrinomonadaceae bacterium]
MKFTNIAIISIVIFAAACTASMITAKNENTNRTLVETSVTPVKVGMSSADEKFDGAKIVRDDAEWRKILTPEQFYILREDGTERPYTGKYHKSKIAGTYYCAACGLALFKTKAMFDSGTGWPSFYAPIYKENVTEIEDKSLG